MANATFSNTPGPIPSLQLRILEDFLTNCTFRTATLSPTIQHEKSIHFLIRLSGRAALVPLALRPDSPSGLDDQSA